MLRRLIGVLASFPLLLLSLQGPASRCAQHRQQTVVLHAGMTHAATIGETSEHPPGDCSKDAAPGQCTTMQGCTSSPALLSLSLAESPRATGMDAPRITNLTRPDPSTAPEAPPPRG